MKVALVSSVASYTWHQFSLQRERNSCCWRKKNWLAACQPVEQVRLPSLLFSVFIVRGLGSAVFKKARLLSSWNQSAQESSPVEKVTLESRLEGGEIQILCKELLCWRRHNFGGNIYTPKICQFFFYYFWECGARRITRIARFEIDSSTIFGWRLLVYYLIYGLSDAKHCAQ